MADTILETLEEDIAEAFSNFAMRPTNSARVKLRTRLNEIAGALEVEQQMLPNEEAYLLSKAITDLRAMGEFALVAPVDALITERDNSFRKEKPAKKEAAPNHAMRNRALVLVGAKFVRDILQFLVRK